MRPQIFPGSRKRAWLSWLFRAAIAIGGLALAVHVALPDGPESLPGTLAAAWVAPVAVAVAWFALACAALGASFAVSALRFQLLLRGAGLHVGWRAILRAYLVAGFFNLVLPGAIFGDVYRVWDARRDTGRGSEVVGITVLERLLALAALASIGLLVAPFLPSTPQTEGLRPAALVLCGLLVAGPLAALHRGVGAWMRGLLARFPHRAAGLSARAGRALAAVGELAERPRTVASAFLLSVLMQWLVVAAVFALAAPLDTTLAWYWFAVVVPFVTLVTSIPVSIAGTGIREVLYVTLFGAVGMKAGVALTLSLAILAAALVWGLVGLVLFALGRRPESELAQGSGSAS